MSICQDCGTDGDAMGLMPIWGYDWESDDDTALSIQQIVGHRCVNGSYCAERVVASGTNAQALGQVARNYENVGDLATQARTILRDWAELSREIARADDAAAREDGWGAMGMS